VYVSTGAWAFDFNGWTTEHRFLAETAAECRRRWPDWDYDSVPVVDCLDGFCRKWNHRLPSAYAGDVIGRANAYLDRFRLRGAAAPSADASVAGEHPAGARGEVTGHQRDE